MIFTDFIQLEIYTEHVWNGKNTAYGAAYMLSWLKYDRVRLVHTRTTHYRKTNASVDCPRLEDCTSWRVGPNFPNVFVDNFIASMETKPGVQLSYLFESITHKISLDPLQTPLIFCHLHVSKLVPWSISSCSWHHFKEMKFPRMMFWCSAFCVTF